MKDKLQSTKCARSLKALADPDRLQIIQCLQGGPRNVGEIARLLRRDLANISHHLGVLRQAGLVIDQKDGKYVRYSLAPDVIHADAEGKGVVDLGCCRLQLGK